LEEFFSTAYKAHPYGQPTLGHMSDIENYNRQDAEAFYRKYYTPANMTIAIVGDAEPEKTIELVKKYWIRIPAGKAARRITTVEPPQKAERTVNLYDKTQPFCLVGWHIPEVEKIILPNGLRLYILEDSTLPLFRASVRVHGGSYLESPEQTGLSKRFSANKTILTQPLSL